MCFTENVYKLFLQHQIKKGAYTFLNGSCLCMNENCLSKNVIMV